MLLQASFIDQLVSLRAVQRVKGGVSLQIFKPSCAGSKL